jgi:hypothetical protein
MSGRVSNLIESIAQALEATPCGSFEEFAARVVPLAQANSDVVIVDVEPEADPPGVIIATASGWLVLVDRAGIVAGKPDPTELARRGRPSPRTAVQRKFSRPVFAHRSVAATNGPH